MMIIHPNRLLSIAGRAQRESVGLPRTVADLLAVLLAAVALVRWVAADRGLLQHLRMLS